MLTSLWTATVNTCMHHTPTCNSYSAECSIFINKTGSECGQIQCYTKSHTLIVLLLLCASTNHHECNNPDVTSTVTLQILLQKIANTFALQIGHVTNCLLHSEMKHLNWQTSGFFALWGRVYNKYFLSLWEWTCIHVHVCYTVYGIHFTNHSVLYCANTVLLTIN